MTEWQPESPQMQSPERRELIAKLIGDLDDANTDFAAGLVERAKWAETLRTIDERLSVLGLSLVNKPWTRNVRAGL